MEEQKSKIKGWRKLGTAVGAITALSLNPTIDFKIAAIIGFIALAEIVCQGILDYGRNRSPKDVG